jgi:hypothetical protein
MLSELNGEENYFTRICVAGLLNTRKIELVQMLLQDINIFHVHPERMPNSHLDNKKMISSSITNMELNDKHFKIQQNFKESLQNSSSNDNNNKLNQSTSQATNSNNNSPSSLNSNLTTNSNYSKSSSNLLTKSIPPPSPCATSPIASPTATTASAGSQPMQLCKAKRSKTEISNSQKITKINDNTAEAIATSLSDVASFQLYASCMPSKTYQPIREQLPFAPSLNHSTQSNNNNSNNPRQQHNVSYLKLEDNTTLDYHLLEQLQNGFTFACVLNEWDMQQSSFLLNVRLESDNNTLIWSRPAWDINNTWNLNQNSSNLTTISNSSEIKSATNSNNSDLNNRLT